MGLSEVRKQELTKAFSVFDRDGSGSITKEELALVLQNLHPNMKPSLSEVNQIMKIMDQNGDGVIELSEFLSTMQNWLEEEGESSKDSTNSKKRGRTDSLDSREELHSKVSKFFLQFSTSSKFEETRKSVHEIKSNKKYNIDIFSIQEDYMDTLDTQVEDKTVIVNQIKKTDLKYLAKCIVSSKSFSEALPYLQETGHLFTIMDLFSSPSQRRSVSDELIYLFESFTPIIQRLIQFLKVDESPELQYASLRILSYMVNGPRISSTPPDNNLHPDKMYFKQKMKEEGALPLIVKFLIPKYRDVYPQIVEECLRFLGNFGNHNESARDFLLDHDIFNPVLDMFAGVFHDKFKPNISLLKNAVFCVSNLCGISHTKHPDWNRVKNVIPVFSELLIYYDTLYDEEIVLYHLCSTLSFLLPGVREESVLIKLIDLLTHKSQFVIQIALNTINKLIVADAFITKIFLKAGLVAVTKILLLHSNQEIRLSTCGLLGTLIGVRGRIQNVLDADIIPIFIDICSKDDYCRWRCVKLLKYMTRGSALQVKQLVTEHSIVQVLCHVLTFFESHDEVLKSVYNFIGSSYNYEMMRDSLIALNGIILAGDIEFEQSDEVEFNPYAEYFDFDCILKIGGLLKQMHETSDLLPWKTEKGGTTIEDTCKGLLVKIKKVADTFKTTQAKQVSKTIDEVLVAFYGEKYISKLDYNKYEANFFDRFKEKRHYYNQLSNIPTTPSDGGNNSLNFKSTIDLKTREENFKRNLFEDIITQAKKENINFTVDQLNSAFEWWKSKCDENGRVQKDIFKQGIEEKFGIKDKMALESYYLSFDANGDGYVDFREFIVGIGIMEKKKEATKKQESLEGIIQLMFRTYDYDNNGYITPDEVFRIFKNVKDAEGKPYNEYDLKIYVQKKFNEIDTDGNGFIDYEEFKDAVLTNKLQMNIAMGF